MIDGLWVVQYEGIQGGGGTVLVFVNGQVLGGDNGFTIIGTYNLTGNDISAYVTVQNYLPSVQSFFDFTGDYDIRMKGVVDGNIIHAEAEIVDRPVSGLSLKMTRVKRLLAKA